MNFNVIPLDPLELHLALEIVEASLDKPIPDDWIHPTDMRMFVPIGDTPLARMLHGLGLHYAGQPEKYRSLAYRLIALGRAVDRGWIDGAAAYAVWKAAATLPVNTRGEFNEKEFQKSIRDHARYVAWSVWRALQAKHNATTPEV